MTTTFILWLSSSLLIALSVATLVYPLATIAPSVIPILGPRGNKRRQLIAQGGSFRFVDTLMRIGAGWISRLKIPRQRAKIETLLLHGGDYLGISPDEFFSLTALSGLFFMGIGGFFSWLLKAGLIFPIFGLLVGAAMPYSQLSAEIKHRFKEINRTLPTVIDLAALCMGAGSDFPGAIRMIVESAGAEKGVIEEEFRRILQELDLGHTRKQALEAFLERAPTESVRDFVSATIQAEQKGNPLAEVLQIQATVLRLHRTVAAEEGAARAGVLMIIPMVLLMLCILLLLVGPFAVKGIG